MKKQLFNAKVRYLGRKVPVAIEYVKEIERFGEIFVLHREVEYSGGRFFTSPVLWRVSHKETGLIVCGATKTRKSAVAAFNKQLDIVLEAGLKLALSRAKG